MIPVTMEEGAPMSLELGRMVYSSFPDLGNEREQEEDSESDDHSLSTFRAFVWATDATLEISPCHMVVISVLISGTQGLELQAQSWVSLPFPYLFLHLKKMIPNDNQR